MCWCCSSRSAVVGDVGCSGFGDRQHRHAQNALAALSARHAAIAAVIYLWFLIAWGLNYRREPLSTQLDFQRRPHHSRGSPRPRVAQRRVVERPAQGTRTPTAGPSSERRAGSAGPGVSARATDLAMTWQVEPGVPKRSLLNFYFTRVSIDGMTDPFFLETLANQSLLPFERPATVAHEWAPPCRVRR